MEITIEKLTELDACRDGVDWFKAQKETALDKVCFALPTVSEVETILSGIEALKTRLFNKKDQPTADAKKEF